MHACYPNIYSLQWTGRYVAFVYQFRWSMLHNNHHNLVAIAWNTPPAIWILADSALIELKVLFFLCEFNLFVLLTSSLPLSYWCSKYRTVSITIYHDAIIASKWFLIIRYSNNAIIFRAPSSHQRMAATPNKVWLIMCLIIKKLNTNKGKCEHIVYELCIYICYAYRESKIIAQARLDIKWFIE